ncbi:MAG: hypothetical protein JO138_08620 [Acidobacteriaceae bacterium]|nr:hypothetical protein [Acidobacteriaceae bacterium]
MSIVRHVNPVLTIAPTKIMRNAVLRHRLVIISAFLFFLGLAVRLLLVSLDPDTPKALVFRQLDYRNGLGGMDEPVRIAISLATTGRYADAYGAATGPTAHCAPLHPLLLSVLVRFLGTGKAGAWATEIATSMASSLAFALLPVLAVAARLKPITGVLAGIAGTLLPINFGYQTAGGFFDAAFTAAALVGLCILMCRIWARATYAMREGAVLGAATGVGSLLNPVVLPVVAAWVIAIAVEHRQFARRVLVFCGACAACYIVPVMPWAIRNLRALGSPIFTRSNFWLEMQVSNNGMLTADMQRNLSMWQWALVHPSLCFIENSRVIQLRAIQRRRVKQLGEVAYMRSKREQAMAWISSHKREFLVLTAQRFRLFWLPRMTRPLQTLSEALLTILGLAGLVLLFQQRARSAWLFAGIFIAYPAVYYLLQASPRYRLPVEPFLFLLAANVFWTFAVKLRMRLGKARWIDHVEVVS